MEELEQDFLEVPDLASQEPSPVRASTPRTSKKRAALGDVDTNVERKATQPKRKKKTNEKQQKPSGVILDVAEFDEQQSTTREEEMCKDLKRIVHTVTKMEKQVHFAIAALDNKIEELTQKIDRHIRECAPADAEHQTPADAEHQAPADATFTTAFSEQALNLPYVQQTPLAATSATAVREQGEHLPFPQQHELLRAPELQPPSSLPHALAHAESPHSDTPLPLPIPEVNPKFTELPFQKLTRQSSKQLQMFCGSIQHSEQSAK